MAQAYSLTLTEAVRWVREQKLSPVELVDETLEVPFVALVRPWRAVLGAPVKEAVDDANDELRRHRFRCPHQVVVFAERVVALGAEVVLVAAGLDVPEAAVTAEEWLREMRHGIALRVHGVPEGR